MKIITVAVLKGGVGKTNFVFNLSTTLALKNHKVLVIDLDPQATLTLNFSNPEYNWR
ncbi:ParA family protein [Spiroplasma endosymbiont of Nebria brevicollis]|uniref:ParA family protein n=1 Tax=Spiroplasma endosymbiont of Nebria brevicollis TaxID=3066284 RepID=UPI00313CE6A5